ncbi:NAD(P)H-dependent oxidoreductase [Kibdelosporangium persicum]|uniref:NADPH-dependent FMN reductase n=1 Tax=Kibdelosporangium persicum TaxID=2698649 RepID=A0ABX2EXE0_9PSEU|nr:NAD(P)H-dependent oxidoreductase [Kibdelosporangium persicum]NRN63716.1 NADPH-dependent FMN reductase [Kibdelosporangium persicum]
MQKFLFLLASSRQPGNTEALARKAAEYLPRDVEQRWLWLEDLPLDPFRDTRQSSRIHPEPEGNERLLLDATIEATDIVIASPLYWYSVSATAKRYLDYWSGWLHLPDVPFKTLMREKTLWGVSTAEERDKSDSLVGTLYKSAEYLKMRWGGVLLGHGHHPGEVLEDASAMAAAESFFQSVYATK